jgi:PAS domain-containing protein
LVDPFTATEEVEMTHEGIHGEIWQAALDADLNVVKYQPRYGGDPCLGIMGNDISGKTIITLLHELLYLTDEDEEGGIEFINQAVEALTEVHEDVLGEDWGRHQGTGVTYWPTISWSDEWHPAEDIDLDTEDE